MKVRKRQTATQAGLNQKEQRTTKKNVSQVKGKNEQKKLIEYREFLNGLNQINIEYHCMADPQRIHFKLNSSQQNSAKLSNTKSVKKLQQSDLQDNGKSENKKKSDLKVQETPKNQLTFFHESSINSELMCLDEDIDSLMSIHKPKPKIIHIENGRGIDDQRFGSIDLYRSHSRSRHRDLSMPSIQERTFSEESSQPQKPIVKVVKNTSQKTFSNISQSLSARLQKNALSTEKKKTPFPTACDSKKRSNSKDFEEILRQKMCQNIKITPFKSDDLKIDLNVTQMLQEVHKRRKAFSSNSTYRALSNSTEKNEENRSRQKYFKSSQKAPGLKKPFCRIKMF